MNPDYEFVNVRGDQIIGEPHLIRPNTTFRVTFNRPEEKEDSELIGKRVRVELDGLPSTGWTVEAHYPPLVYLSGNGYPENGKLVGTNEGWVELDTDAQALAAEISRNLDEADPTCFVCKKAQGTFFASRHKGCSPPGSAEDLPDAAPFKKTALYQKELDAFNADPGTQILRTCGGCFEEHAQP